MTKVIDYFLLMDAFEQQCFVLKCMLQSPWLKDNVNTIGIDQFLSKKSIYEHNCLENIKTLCTQASKCDNYQKFKDNIEAAMVSTTEWFTNNSPISPMTITPVKKLRAWKPLCLFTKTFDVKRNCYLSIWSY